MKVLKVMKEVLLTACLLVPTMSPAATWYGFCFGKNEGTGKTLCSAIQVKTPDFSTYCKTWSSGHGLGSWGNNTATSIPTLEAKQTSKCDEVEGAPVPGTTYQCFAEVLCPGSGTSSIHLDPIGFSVVAPSPLEAGKLCLSAHGDSYLESLKGTIGGNCYVKVKAIE